VLVDARTAFASLRSSTTSRAYHSNPGRLLAQHVGNRILVEPDLPQMVPTMWRNPWTVRPSPILPALCSFPKQANTDTCNPSGVLTCLPLLSEMRLMRFVLGS
jgi:hypothetical protein